MSGGSGVEIGGPQIAKEYDEDEMCTFCSHGKRSHSSTGCLKCNCPGFKE